MSQPIENYTLLSDGESAALLCRDGSIDWLCWPRFDDDACFSALLGTPENGHWALHPIDTILRQDRRYQDNTLVMETDFEVSGGAVRIIDFMPVGVESQSVIRIVEGLRGAVRMRSQLRLRFDYGALPPWTTSVDGTMEARVGPDLVMLRADCKLNVTDKSTDATFEVTTGERVTFVMSYGRSHLPPPAPVDAEAELSATQQYWNEWISTFDNSKTMWPAQVKRSLLTLKALIYRPSGAIVAAPTTSLPEAPGGRLNWDYRYCWLRDASFALVALLNAGFHEEANEWRKWLLGAIAGSPENIRIMYRVDGGRHMQERTLDSLQGYQYARPVRVGNAAGTQHQVDVLGEIVDCLDVARRAGLPATEQDCIVEQRILEHLEKVWNTPGSGIWESRSEPRHYTYSRVMAWVAVDRFLSHRARTDVRASPIMERLTALRQTIRDEICHEGWNEALGSFTQYYGGHELDASMLLLPLVGFLPVDDPRMASTIDTVQRELSDGGLIRREKALAQGPNEGAFLACSCWMADCLQMQGRSGEARAQFERVLAVSNDLGLLSEQYNVPGKHLAGNFPQALTHLAIINTALNLCGPTLQRGGG
ncbi:glycoside hydrolase family 15 protein [Caballeronia humi]|uniref:Glycoside hydrolase 15-like protein n=1 Tax=Caballeronia humi TaxID=326474 RepID=A0A158JCU6_9BURK|nr:glycoside hydrolase family 15 protein [Caballeronia humi]SAL66657.1 glycoside hydrolase 15-like protein [Caballeronia humi]